MPKLSKVAGLLALSLCGYFCTLRAQIEGGYWANSHSVGPGVVCNDEQLDSIAICATRVYCTDPPNPVSFFDITASANDRCPNQPVANSAFTSGAIRGLQESADGKAVAFLYNRRIEESLIAHDCMGVTLILIDFADPYGCEPPPPPPPPPDLTCGMSYGELLLAQQDCKRDGMIFAEDICMCSITPIILDANGHGFKLTSASSGVRFRTVPSGIPVQMAWTEGGSDTAFLVLDRNHNGTVDDMTEMFGNVAPQPASESPNGFLALSEFDKVENGGDSNGIIDQEDGVYSALRLWIDRNHNGISEPEELYPLNLFGVRSLSLDYRTSRRRDQFGNVFRYRAKVNESDRVIARPRFLYDVLLLTTD